MITSAYMVWSRRTRCCWLVLLGLIFAAPSAAAPPQERLDGVERLLSAGRAKAEVLERQGRKLETDVSALQTAILSTARKAQDLEEVLSVIERTLAGFEAEAAERTSQLAAKRQQLARTLAALQKIALQPPESLLVAPTAPIDTVRGALLLRVAVENIERRAKALRADLDDLARLRRDIAAQRRALAPKLEALESERMRLARLVARKRALRSAVSWEQRAAQRRAERLAADAKDLRELIDRLERAAREKAEREARELAELKAREKAKLAARELAEHEAAARLQAEAGRRAKEEAARQQAELSRPQAPMQLQKPANVRSFPSAPGAASLVMPARGRVIMRFGQETEEGGMSKGVTIATRREAQVVAPYDGQVAYAGIFRGYGQILIIEHGGRYHTLLAGLEQLGAVVGQWVLAGEPVGTMGRPEDHDPELYLELRRTGQPINPLPWLATTNDRVRG